MSRRNIFKFTSITYRLIFGCVVSAIGIYGLSYFQSQQLVQKINGRWITDITQSRLNIIVNEIEGKLAAIQQSAQIASQFKRQLITRNSTQNNAASSNEGEFLLILKALAEQHSEIQAIALINFPTNSPTNKNGWQYQRQTGSQNLNKDDTESWLSRCSYQPNTKTITAQWSQPHQLSNRDLSSITYCQALSGSEILAIEINLDWISPFMAQQLVQADDLNFLKLGVPFVLSSPNPQASQSNHWIVKPVNVDQQQAQLFIGNQNLEETNSKINSISQKVPSTGWQVGIVFPQGKLAQFQQKYLWLLVITMARDMVLLCVVIAVISGMTNRSLRALIKSTEEMAQGNLNAALPPVTSVDEVGRLTQAFGRMQTALLQHILEQQEATAAKQKLESEITLAAEIQRTMLPRTNIAPNSSYDISALLKPARIVGGDLYDFFLLGSDRLCIIVGDAAGKGFPAALMMACTITLIRSLTKTYSTPVEILHNVNRELCIDNGECQFVTLFCGVLNLNNGKFSYASAGHDAPLLLKNQLNNQQVHFLDLETGSPLGLYEDAKFSQSECILAPDDLILLYTDGITEAMNLEGEIFSDQLLIENLISYFPNSPSRAIRTVQHFCDRFVGNAPQSDDITLLVVQYLPSSPFSEVNTMQWSLSINNELTQLEQVRQSISQILEAKSVTIDSIEDTQLIVEEVIVNVMKYGYGNSNEGHIDLKLELNADRLILTFADGGKPFNPITEIVTPDLSMNDDERSQGGLGFFLVQQLSESIEYKYLNDKNILTVCQLIAKIS